ncbi:MAG TPA: NADH-quinone oxidoreductase subunit N [Anaerovoracaceae bacterium]|nr:NADH-quinone oxidoreductase subunit N [Anaerovoracaceae bacterium]
MTVTDFLCLAPFLILAIAPVVIMIVISVLRNYEVIYGFSIFSLLASFASIFFIVPAVPHSIEPLFIIDIYSLFFLGIITLSALLVALLSHDYIKQLEGVREEYYIILFTSTLGASLLAVSCHFILLFLGIETLSISLYILIAFRRSKDSSIEAGIKYLILASVSSSFLLFGMALIYTEYGTMQFNGIVSAISENNQMSPLVISGFALIMVGIGFKLGLVPFHMWTPDVYQGAPAPVTAYIATVSKGAVMAVLIRFFFNIRGYDNRVLFIVISGIAILSMFIGNLLAIRQQNIKRLLAYSSIANMGYLIVILLTGTNKGIQASIFYLISYFATTIGAFGVISLLSTSKYEAEKIEDYKGLFWKRPWIAIVFTLSLLSLAGIPITAGFIAKFYVIFEGMKAGLMLLVVSMIINSVIGLYYYLRIITALFSAANETKLPALSFAGNITLSLVALSILILGVYPGWLIDIIMKFVAL